MRSCLSERALFLVLENDADDVARAHVQTCATCATRYDALARDVRVLGSTLRQWPPPASAAPARVWWKPALAAAAIMLAVWGVWGTGRRDAVDDGASPSLAEVSRALFSTEDVDVLAAADSNEDFRPLEAALHGDGPDDDAWEIGDDE